MRWLLWVVVAAAAALGALFLGLYRLQEYLLFAPQKLPSGHAFTEPDTAELSIAVPGATLSALHLRLPDPKGVVFFLHGNAGNLATWFDAADFYRRANFDLFMLDYRGYGKSTGSIRSEAQLRADVDAAWDGIAPLYRGRRVVLLGRSLGTALAAGLAARIQPDLTILVSPYWSMVDMAALHYPWVPAALLRYPLETHRDLAAVKGTVLLLHGDRDALIPPEHSARLAAVAQAPRLVLVPGAAHNDVQGFDVYLRAIAGALAAL